MLSRTTLRRRPIRGAFVLLLVCVAFFPIAAHAQTPAGGVKQQAKTGPEAEGKRRPKPDEPGKAKQQGETKKQPQAGQEGQAQQQGGEQERLEAWRRPLSDEPRTRAELIERDRREKKIALWPERQSPIATIINDEIERGLLDGFENGRGKNGFQLPIGGMRSGQGAAFGVGYRRADWWNDRIDWRVTARGTIELAYMFDFWMDFPRVARSEHTFFNLYARYENSPQMDYYGPGPFSREENRTSYRLEDLRFLLEGGYQVGRIFRVGATGGLYGAHIGAGQRGGVPSTEEVFDDSTTPGLSQQPDLFLVGGVFAQLDFRDRAGGPRSGGNYVARFTVFSDRDLERYSFKRIDLRADQYIPYFNKTRVIALHVRAVMTEVDETQDVPFYLQPTLGGNDDLRGFARYRYYDENSILFIIEHRWHSFSGMDVAVFADAGKVVPRAKQLDFHDLRFDAGIGFRFKVKEVVVMRIDNAISNEGYRFMWTFNNIF